MDNRSAATRRFSLLGGADSLKQHCRLEVGDITLIIAKALEEIPGLFSCPDRIFIACDRMLIALINKTESHPYWTTVFMNYPPKS
jgi:hypothetical protein